VESSPQLDLPHISDEVMRQSLQNLRGYAVVILKKGPNYDPPRSDSIIWEHGRRNFALRAAGLLAICLPEPGQHLPGGYQHLRHGCRRGRAHHPAIRLSRLVYLRSRSIKPRAFQATACPERSQLRRERASCPALATGGCQPFRHLKENETWRLSRRLDVSKTSAGRPSSPGFQR
jgi:hypothetical protein